MTKWKFLQINCGSVNYGKNTRFHLLETADDTGKSNGWLLKWTDGNNWYSGHAVSKLAAYVLHRASDVRNNDVIQQLITKGHVHWVVDDTEKWI